MKRGLLAAAAGLSMIVSAAAEAAVIKFTGSANGRDVSGLITYDPNTPAVDTTEYTSGTVSLYFPGTLKFVSGGLKRNSEFTLVVGDAKEGNSEGATDVFNAFVPAGSRESYGFLLDYGTASAWDSSAIPTFLASGPATFSYDYAGDGFSIPVTFSTAVPEPTTWAMMMMGFGVSGAAMRRRPRRKVATV